MIAAYSSPRSILGAAPRRVEVDVLACVAAASTRAAAVNLAGFVVDVSTLAGFRWDVAAVGRFIGAGIVRTVTVLQMALRCMVGAVVLVARVALALAEAVRGSISVAGLDADVVDRIGRALVSHDDLHVSKIVNARQAENRQMSSQLEIFSNRTGAETMVRGPKASTKIKRVPKSPAQRIAEAVASKAEAIGAPAIQVTRGMHAIVDVPLRDAGRVVTEHTLINRGGTPVARRKAAKLLSDSQVAAIDHCETLWFRLGGKALVMDLARIPGAGQGNGWAEQEALDDLKRIKGYFPAKWWAIFENVCRFDKAAGFAGSALTTSRNDQVTAARTTV